jgi:hypothetical protein
MLRPNRARRLSAPVLLALCLVVGAGGCSFKLVRPAPPRADWPTKVDAHSSEDPCMSSPAPPIADGVVFTAANALAYLERNSGAPIAAVGLVVVSVPFLVSAVYGAYHVNKCKRYQSLFRNAP